MIRNRITVEGHVKHPGDYELKPGMRLLDLIKETEVLSDVYFTRAVITRFNFFDESFSRIEVDLNRLLDGDPLENVLLQPWDRLRVFSKDEVAFTPMREVQVLGAVQRPGMYVRSDSMRVSDLIFEAGGLLPGYYKMATLARARSENETEIVTIDLEALISGSENENLILRDQDILNVKKRADFYDAPSWVTITGEVNYPGPYALKDKNVCLIEIVKAAGGFTPEAYLNGLVLLRRKEFIVQDEQEDLLRSTNRSSAEEMEIHHYQEEMKNRLKLSPLTQKPSEEESAAPRMPAISGSVISGGDIEKTMAAAVVPSIAEGTGKTMEKTFESLEDAPAVGAVLRTLTDADLVFEDMERISVDVKSLTEGGSQNLHSGDDAQEIAIRLLFFHEAHAYESTRHQFSLFDSLLCFFDKPREILQSTYLQGNRP